MVAYIVCWRNRGGSVIFMKMRIIAILGLLYLFVTIPVFSQVDVMFSDDFENLEAGDTPDMFLPSGSANPDWDNELLNPNGSPPTLNTINSDDSYGNATNKYVLRPSVASPVLLGANFNPSTDRFVTIEYDILVDGVANADPSGEIYYADGYGNLDGTGGTTKIAIHLEFNDDGDFPDDALPQGKNGLIYRTVGQDNDVTTTPPADSGSEKKTSIQWVSKKWYRVQVIADQESQTFDLKITEKDTSVLSGK